MTYKRILYSTHAARRLRGRGITRAMVRQTLATGEAIETLTIVGAKQRFVRELRFGRGVYLEDSRDLTIVTVMWKS